MIKISVIVPVYNVEQYLERCVQSILNQSFRNLELILVDDGSPDQCPALCDTFAKMDNRVRVIHQENTGVAAARNVGLDVARGEYITFVDSDDYIDPEMYEAMIRIAQKYDCDLVMCDCIKEFENHTETYTHDIRTGYYDRKQLEQEYFSHLLIMPNIEYPPTISNWLCLFKRTLCNEHMLRYEKGIRYSEDLLFGARLIYHAQSFYYMKNQIFYHYNCINNLSATHNPSLDKWKDYVKLYDKIQQYFGNCKEYDFSEQIDRVLLFFVYNAVGDLIRNRVERKKRNLRYIQEILHEPVVIEMFKKLNIRKLCISRKQKLLTFCYAHPITIVLVSYYFTKKRSV